MLFALFRFVLAMHPSISRKQLPKLRGHTHTSTHTYMHIFIFPLCPSITVFYSLNYVDTHAQVYIHFSSLSCLEIAQFLAPKLSGHAHTHTHKHTHIHTHAHIHTGTCTSSFFSRAPQSQSLTPYITWTRTHTYTHLHPPLHP